MKKIIQHYQKHTLKYWGLIIAAAIIVYFILTIRHVH
jgi:hypothetical protein